MLNVSGEHSVGHKKHFVIEDVLILLPLKMITFRGKNAVSGPVARIIPSSTGHISTNMFSAEMSSIAELLPWNGASWQDLTPLS